MSRFSSLLPSAVVPSNSLRVHPAEPVILRCHELIESINHCQQWPLKHPV